MLTHDLKVQDVFATDVTRDIPPVIYFHEQSPEKLQEEVSEYIITGGYSKDDPRHQRLPEGIHEQFVRLLKNLHERLSQAGGADLPACWVSGFYGSGKSSFAKLLGLSLDHRRLPDGVPLAEALLSRDDSPQYLEFRESFQKVASFVDSMAVVFDIGAAARDDEHIHTTVRRMLQARLDYCASSPAVADYELKLEMDGCGAHLRLRRERPWESLGRTLGPSAWPRITSPPCCTASNPTATRTL